MQRGRKKADGRDHYMAKVLFREWSEKIIELDACRLNDVEFQDEVFGVYPIGVRFPAGSEQRDDARKERNKTNLLLAFTCLDVLVYVSLDLPVFE